MAEQQEELEREPFDPGTEETDDQPVVEGDQPGRRERRKAKKDQKKAQKEGAKAQKEGAKADKKEAKAEKKDAKAEKKPAKAKPKAKENAATYRRVGHKGADSIVEGNTVKSFEAAVEAGVEMVEFDVLRTRDGQLVVAHDHADAARRRPLTLTAALDAFCHPPLDQVELNCDLKLPGREAELAGSIAGHGLTERAMVSTMEIESLVKLRSSDQDLRLGWTIPKTTRDWSKEPWAKPALRVGISVLRRRVPQMIRDRAPELDLDAIWIFHLLVTPDVIAAAEEVDLELIAWTIDDPERVAELAELGVHGIVSNDPRILS